MYEWHLTVPYEPARLGSKIPQGWRSDNTWDRIRLELTPLGFTLKHGYPTPGFNDHTVVFTVSHPNESAVTWYLLKHPDTRYRFDLL